MSKRNLTDQSAKAREGRIKRNTVPAGMTAAQAAEASQGAFIGSIVRQREQAADVLASAQAFANATGTPIDYGSHYGDKLPDGSRLTLGDARDMLAAAEESAKKWERPTGRYVRRDDERMTVKDFLSIATAAASATAAAINRQVSRRDEMNDEEYGDLRGFLIGEMVRLNARRDRMRCGRPADVLRYIDRAERSPLTPARAADEDAPRWKVILSADEAEEAAGTLTSASAVDSLRGRWIGFLILRGREWRAARADRMASTLSLWELVEEANAEDPAARLEARGAAEVREAGATVGAVDAALSAAGKPLRKAERLALEAALTGLSRRELAQRIGQSPDNVKKGITRGRASLAQRWPTPAEARRQMARAADAAEGPRHGRPADVLAWIDANPEARERIAREWQTMSTTRPAAAPPAPRRRPRRALVAPMPGAPWPTRCGRPVDVLAWIDRADRMNVRPRPLHVGYAPPALRVRVTLPGSLADATPITPAWGPGSVNTSERPNAARILPARERAMAEAARLARFPRFTEPTNG